MKENKFFWIMVCLTLVVVLIGFGNRILVDRISEQVILKLQKDYCPSPYGPGLDPDKIDPDKIMKKDQSKTFKTTTFQEPEKPVEWDVNWEKQRSSFFKKKITNFIDLPFQSNLAVIPPFVRMPEKDRMLFSEKLPKPSPNPYL